MKIFISACEASGDLLGGRLMQALRKEDPNCEFMGVGGPMMQEQGLESLVPFERLSVMGIVEVIKHIKPILHDMKTISDFIHKEKPDIIVTIDAPSFHGRLAKKIKHLNIPIIHYVAPTVWAWRPKRAKKMAQWADHLLTLFPFEKPYFDAVGLETTWVGHPVIESSFVRDENFNERFHIDKDEKVFTLLPGSRAQEIDSLLPVFLQAFELFQQRHLDIKWKLFIPTLPHLKNKIFSYIKESTSDIIVIDDVQTRYQLFSNSFMALAASGTVSLELGLAGVPHVLSYRVHPITYWILKKLILTEYVSLINILFQKRITPECLQHECNAETLSKALDRVFASPEKMQKVYHHLPHLLKPDGALKPSSRAASVVLEYALKHSKKNLVSNEDKNIQLSS